MTIAHRRLKVKVMGYAVGLSLIEVNVFLVLHDACGGC